MASIQKSTTVRYVVALSIIAILSTVAFFTLLGALNSSNSTGYIVNISGKQRMLSQHIALDVHRIHKDFTDNNYSNDNTLAKQILIQHTQEMLNANRILSTGNLNNGGHVTLSKSINRMYFGDINLAKRVEEYNMLAQKILTIKEHSSVDELVQSIDRLSEPLLIDLNRVVLQYQIEGEEKLKDMKTLETIAWVMTIITLLLEVIFIFQPMVRTIVSLSASNKEQIQNLSNEVELRTIHLEKANMQLRDLAFHDPLTGLRNRLTLESDIENAISAFHMHHAPYAALMFDIDLFKNVNDTYGHDIGDFVLREISNILSSSVREGDKVYRAGGEEFVVLLNRVNYDESIKIAEKIRLLIQDHIFKTDGIEIKTTISSGLYHTSIIDLKDVKSVVKLIDTALYISKESGRNKVTIVTKELCDKNNVK